jgi:hypothetical protein
MALTESDFERRARFTYELGRLSWAAQMLLFVGPLLVVARLIDRPMSLIVPVGTALVLLATGLAFVHLRYKRAALSGMAAGMPALLLPWIFRFGGEVCVVDRCFDLCLPSSLAAGALAGAVVALRAVREERHWSFWAAAISIAGLLGALGCSIAGAAGVLGLLAGVAAGSAPVLFRAQLRGGS